MGDTGLEPVTSCMSNKRLDIAYPPFTLMRSRHPSRKRLLLSGLLGRSFPLVSVSFFAFFVITIISGLFA